MSAPPRRASWKGSALRAIRRAGRAQRPVLLALSSEAPPPSAWPDEHAASQGPSFYLEREDAPAVLSALGACWSAGPSIGPFGDDLERLFAGAVLADEKLRPFLRGICSLPFSDSPSLSPWADLPRRLVFIPRRLRVVEGGKTGAIACALVGPEDSPGEVEEKLFGREDHFQAPADFAGSGPGLTRMEWTLRCEKALAAIREGSLSKIVLVRRKRFEWGHSQGPLELLRALRGRHPQCLRYWVTAPGGAHFVGATPERLFSKRGSEARSLALAGSAPRGRDPRSDQENIRSLLASRKNRHEHQLVVEAVRDALAGLCTRVEAPQAAQVLTLSNVHHLSTPLRGRLRGGVSSFDLLERLHPTPAVGGTPRQAALELLREIEPEGRGWYAGPIGWIGADGNSEFFVALRGALLRGDEAHLFAGCGLVEASDPAGEWDETQWKLDAVASCLGLKEAAA